MKREKNNEAARKCRKKKKEEKLEKQKMLKMLQYELEAVKNKTKEMVKLCERQQNFDFGFV